MRISDWSSDVCSSDLGALEAAQGKLERLVFADFDAWHRNLCGFGGPARRRGPARGTRKPPESLRRAAYDSGSHRGRATAAAAKAVVSPRFRASARRPPPAPSPQAVIPAKAGIQGRSDGRGVRK